ncbi:MAG: PEP-CTERM sorting domain-containing protein [Verrucomicrobiota bacterium]
MKKTCTHLLVAAVSAATIGGAKAATTVTYDNSFAGSFMNVHELTANGGGGKGGFVFGGGWGVSDLVAIQDVPSTSVTLSPNSVGDPNEFWYQNTSGAAPDPVNPGGPGQLGNKWMEANFFNEVGDGSLAGEELTFSVDVTAFSFTAAHTLQLFIADFEAGFANPIFTEVAVNGTGVATVTANLTNNPTNIVQYGFRVSGENVWVTDVAPFGSATIGAIPEPSAALLGFAGLAGLMLRRRR